MNGLGRGRRARPVLAELEVEREAGHRASSNASLPARSNCEIRRTPSSSFGQLQLPEGVPMCWRSSVLYKRVTISPERRIGQLLIAIHGQWADRRAACSSPLLRSAATCFGVRPILLLLRKSESFGNIARARHGHSRVLARKPLSLRRGRRRLNDPLRIRNSTMRDGRK